MGMCLDVEGCGFENRANARFCARCGIPLRASVLQGRYEIVDFVGKDRGTATLKAIDRSESVSVTIRALIPRGASAQEQESFLQDAELAVALSARVDDPGSIRVID